MAILQLSRITMTVFFLQNAIRTEQKIQILSTALCSKTINNPNLAKTVTQSVLIFPDKAIVFDP